jgi:hypothetical protein
LRPLVNQTQQVIAFFLQSPISGNQYIFQSILLKSVFALAPRRISASFFNEDL